MKIPVAWTAQPARAARCGGYRHFALIGQRGKGPERAVELEAVLERGYRLLVPLRELRDRDAWLPGWQRLPPDPDPQHPGSPSAAGGPPAQEPAGGGGDLPLAGPGEGLMTAAAVAGQLLAQPGGPMARAGVDHQQLHAQLPYGIGHG